MGRFPLLVDEHVPRVFTKTLTSNGFDVVTVQERYGEGSVDADVLADCVAEGRIVVTNDRDFVRLADEQDHEGVIIYTDRTLLLNDPLVATNAVDDIGRHYDDLQNTVEWLDNWV